MEISSNENAMTLIQEQNLIGFWDWEISAKRKYLSPVFKHMLGYEEHEISNDPDSWMNLILKEDQPLVVNAYQKHISSKGIFPYEVKARYHHKNGTIVHILSKGKVSEWDYMGNPVKMIGYYTDVSSVVREYASIEEKYEQLKAVVDMMNAGIWSYDVNSGKQFWSDNFYSTLGYSNEEIAPSYFNMMHVLVHPEDNLKLLNAINEQIKNKTAYELDIRLRDKQGVYNTYSISTKVSFAGNDQPARINGYILKRKISEVAYIGDVSTKAEPNVAADILHMPAGEWEYDLNRARFTFSKEALDILELPDEQSFKFDRIDNMFNEESRESFQNGFNKAVYSKENYEVTLVCTTQKGNIKTIVEKGSPVVDSSGKVTALKGTLLEINSRKATEIELSGSSMSQVLDQNKRLLNFAHIASHNLRSHASNLQMILQVLASSQSEEEKKFCMESLEKISGSLTKSINNLNDLMQVEKDLNKTKIPIAFKDVMATVMGTLSQQIADSKAVIDADFSKCPIIDYVPAYIESIILNLVSNAIKYKHQQRTPHIVIKSFFEEGNTMLTVKDNGVGIDLSKHKDKLFRMHQTFHNHPDSRGIGLLITKNQIEAMGGTIDVESEPGIGTKFTIRF